MATPIMTGNLTLQRYLRDQYWAARDAGMTKHEAHSVSFQEMLEANDLGYIIEDEETDTEEMVNPYKNVIYSNEPGKGF